MCEFFFKKREELITHRIFRSANRKCTLALFEPLTQTKINQFDVKIFIEQNVFAFEIAINNASVVKKFCK